MQGPSPHLTYHIRNFLKLNCKAYLLTAKYLKSKGTFGSNWSTPRDIFGQVRLRLKLVQCWLIWLSSSTFRLRSSPMSCRGSAHTCMIVFICIEYVRMGGFLSTCKPWLNQISHWAKEIGAISTNRGHKNISQIKPKRGW